MEKFLIVRCEELMNTYECDCNRVPLKICNNWKKEDTAGCEVYEIESDGNIGKIVKEYGDTSDDKKGFCLFKLDGGRDLYENKDEIKILDFYFTNETADTFTKTKIYKKWEKILLQKPLNPDFEEFAPKNSTELRERFVENDCCTREDILETSWGIGAFIGDIILKGGLAIDGFDY